MRILRDHLGEIIKGGALKVLKTFPSESVQCVVTSPPYWGLRDYGHEGQGGLEDTPEAHVKWIVKVMRKVRRVLRADGTLWLNYGDCYASSGKSGIQALDKLGERLGTGGGKKHSNQKSGRAPCPAGLKHKDLVLMPFRIALALQEDGWWVRSDIIWHKSNPMPESVTDRPANAHEHVFLLTKSARYFYDADAVREPHTGLSPEHYGQSVGSMSSGSNGERIYKQGDKKPRIYNPLGRNLRSVWTIPTQAYPGAHFATFPEALVEPCIKAGTSEKGACPECGMAWKREIERTSMLIRSGPKAGGYRSRTTDSLSGTMISPPKSRMIGWKQGCECPPAPPIPCVVLDPFAGSGTVGIVAYRLGREFVGIDLAGGNFDYGGHTAHDRIQSVRSGGRSLEEHLAHDQAGQTEIDFTD